jgi:hypothetical protein
VNLLQPGHRRWLVVNWATPPRARSKATTGHGGQGDASECLEAIEHANKLIIGDY